jgi:hypothetical protein
MVKIIKKEYDDNGNITYSEDSNGYWVKQEFDSNGNITYYETSKGLQRHYII